MTWHPLVAAIETCLTRHHTGSQEPVTPAPWMTAAAQEIADAIADGCRRNISVNNIYPRCVCAEINDALNRRKAFRHDDKLWPAELECTYFTPRDADA